MSAIVKTELLSVRAMELSDLDRVMSIERAAYMFPWSMTIFRDCLRANYVCCVAERMGQSISGFALMSHGADEAHVLNLCVNPQCHREGVGSALLQHLIQSARTLHVDSLFLEVRMSNQPAQELYYNYGFSQIGVRKNYYPAPDGREDAMVLAISLLV